MAEAAIKGQLATVLEKTGDVAQALQAVAAYTAAHLADVTTEAVRSGYEHAVKRAGLSR